MVIVHYTMLPSFLPPSHHSSSTCHITRGTGRNVTQMSLLRSVPSQPCWTTSPNALQGSVHDNILLFPVDSKPASLSSFIQHYQLILQSSSLASSSLSASSSGSCLAAVTLPFPPSHLPSTHHSSLHLPIGAPCNQLNGRHGTRL